MNATARPARAVRAVQALDERLDGNPHQPGPAWTCRTCPGDVGWPCSPARTRLAEAYPGDWLGLSVYMGSLLTAALTEMPATPPAELHERFTAWTRGPHPAR